MFSRQPDSMSSSLSVTIVTDLSFLGPLGDPQLDGGALSFDTGPDFDLFFASAAAPSIPTVFVGRSIPVNGARPCSMHEVLGDLNAGQSWTATLKSRFSEHGSYGGQTSLRSSFPAIPGPWFV